MNHYVHYTVKLSPEAPPKFCTAGPYSTIDEVLAQKQDIAGYARVSEVFISEQSWHPNGKKAVS